MISFTLAIPNQAAGPLGGELIMIAVVAALCSGIFSAWLLLAAPPEVGRRGAHRPPDPAAE